MIRKQLYDIDMLRMVAIILVVFAHFVSVGGGAKEIPSVIGPNTALPLIDNSMWTLHYFEIYMLNMFSTQTGILGVTLFFIITGYLIPMMLERYHRRAFLINRFFRLFAVLVVGTSIIALVVWLSEGIVFPISSYFASWSLTYPFIGVKPIVGVFWTLIIEVFFYLSASIIGRFSIFRLYLLQALLLALILTSVRFPEIYYLKLIATQAKYLLIICVGSAVFLAERESCWNRKIGVIGSAFILTYLGFQLFKLAHGDSSTYANLMTHVLACSLFLLLRTMNAYRLNNYLPHAVWKLSNLVYPIYIIHVPIGFTAMILMRNYTHNPYLMLLAAVFSSVGIAKILHIFVERPGIKFGKKITQRLEKES